MKKTILPNVLDLTPDTSLQMMKKSLTGSKVWTSEDLSKVDWEIKFTKKALDEIHLMADMMYRNPLPLHLREPAEFEIPELRRIFSQAKKILNQGCGFCVIERMPMEEIREEELIGCYWIISQLIGRTVAQKWDGTMIYDVTDTGQSFSYGVRGSYTNVELFFHNDNAFGISLPEYVGLLCKNTAQEGGVSRFCSLYSVHNRMLEKYPRHLERLYRSMLFDRQKEHADGAAKTTLAPFFSWNGNQLKARVNVSLVHKGYKLAKIEMDDELKDSLESLAQVVSSPDLWIEAPLDRGQIQFLNNLELVHFRSHFNDHEDPRRKRHLYRTWHRNTGARSYDG